MIRRLFSMLFGLGLGLAVGATLMRRFDRAAQAVTPAALAGRAGAQVGQVANRFQAAWHQTRNDPARRQGRPRREFAVPVARDILVR